MLPDALAHLLNPEQLQAVTAPRGPLLVVAGAGTGKTRVVTCRVAHLIRQGIPPYRILAVTFTNKAAREMKARIEAGVSGQSVWAGTFHSFAARVLRREAELVGFTPDFSIYDEDDAKSTVKAVADGIMLTDAVEDLEIDDVRREISGFKNACVAPEEVASADRRTRFIADAYRLYQAALRERNAMDFDDLLLNLHNLLTGNADVRGRYASRFDAVLVDEYQDTNAVQARIVDILSEKHGNLTVTGDPDQSIYSWRGARLENILQFQARYPEAVVVRLERNYRSTPDIIRAADTLIRNNAERLERGLRSQADSGTPVAVAMVDDEFAEARWILELVESRIRSSANDYSDFAVLYRTNFQSRALETVALEYGIPYVVFGGQAFFERQEVRDVIAYLRLVLNPSDAAAFRRALVRPSRGVGEKTVDRIVAYASAHAVDLFAAVDALAQAGAFGARQTSGLNAFISLRRTLLSLPPSPVAPFVRAVVSGAGFSEYWKEHKQADRIENVEELVNAAAQFDDDNPDGSLRSFLDMVSLVTDQDRATDSQTSGRVMFMTLHAAKGLEFPVVFLAGLAEGLFPHSRSIGEDSRGGALEEERRLCYVGMTRAMRELYLMSPAMRRIGGGMVRVQPSRFLSELPEDEIDWEDVRSTASSAFWSGASASRRSADFWSSGAPSYAKPSRSRRTPDASAASADAVERVYDEEYSAEVGFSTGDRVYHKVFGAGTVEQSGSQYVVVKFSSAGRKRLALSFAKLRKIGQS
ncbi:MAG: UvrD-helicase domain-containing protein [Planctomycetes bacterium]|nr:UvrD-helicase domain-containing protein [Planctomycetota bacterium]